MRKSVFELSFQWDDGPESKVIVLTVPENVTDNDIIGVLKATHQELCEDKDGEDVYGTCGRCPETLMTYVCKNKKDWSWDEPDFALDLD